MQRSVKYSNYSAVFILLNVSKYSLFPYTDPVELFHKNEPKHPTSMSLTNTILLHNWYIGKQVNHRK